MEAHPRVVEKSKRGWKKKCVRWFKQNFFSRKKKLFFF